MTDQQPSVGRIVHYVSYGTPGGEYTSQCRAAIIAGVAENSDCDLVVLNPTGLFQFQRMTDANKRYSGPRHPLGMYPTPASELDDR